MTSFDNLLPEEGRPTLPNGWPVVPKSHVIAFGVFAVVFWLLILASREQFVAVIDHVNLAIHETGHLLFRPLGFTMHIWGGTLFQLIVPLGIGVYFWRKRQTAGVAVAGLWLGKSLLHVAVYMSDAQARALHLVGGNIHDWNWIFNRLGCLDSCESIAGACTVVAWIIMFASAGWFVRRWWIGVEYAQQQQG